MPTRPLLPPEALIAARSRWDLAIESLLGLLLLFMPLAFGAVDAWSEMIALALAATLAIVVAVRAAVDRSFTLPWSWAFVPLGVFIGVVVLQMVPLPRAWTSLLSPASVELRTELLESSDSPRIPISMYPLATAHMLRLVLIGAAVFFAATSAFPTPQHIKRLLLIVFAVGCAEAVLALVQIATGADRLYWTFDAGASRLTAGSFINYSNFSQFMNLSIGAGLALLLVRLLDDSRRGDLPPSYSGGYVTGYTASRLHTFLPTGQGGVNLSDPRLLIGGLILSAVAVFASLSRNGAISLVLAGVIVGTALFARGTLSRRGWILAIFPLGALAVLLLFGFDVIYERLATLQQTDQLASRWELTLGVLRAWRDFPWLGSGLGTHEFVFPMYDTAISPTLAGHADNDYAQLLEETGVIGAAAVTTFLGIVGAALVALCRKGTTPISAAAFGLAFGLIAVAIHSASDFGQHLPAVFCLSAVLCGVALQLHRMDCAAKGTAFHAAPLSGVRPRATAGALALIVAIVSAWLLGEAYAAHVGEQWWAAATLVEEQIEQAGADATDADYADLLAAMTQAAAAQPEDVEYAYTLNLDRWRSLSRAVDPATGRIILPSATGPLIGRIADELAAARPLCPTYGPPYALEGQLRLFLLEQPQGRELIRKGVRLAAYDAPTCYIAGELAAREGSKDEAARLLTRTVMLAPSYFGEVIRVCLDDLDAPELARQLAGRDYRQLTMLADLAAADETRADFVGQLRQEAESQLRERANADTATPSELAQLAAIDAASGNDSAAAALYQRALVHDYNQIEWRFARANALAALGQNEQALREARICLRLNPVHAGARQLAEQLE